MSANKIIVVVTIIIGILFVWFLTNREDIKLPTEINTEEVRSLGQVPNFSLADNEGNTVSPAMFEDKILVVNSWAVWCPFCKDELTDFRLLQEEYKDEIVVIAIDRAESLEETKGFTDSVGVTDSMIFLLDPEDSFYKDIGGFTMPETIFVDGDGNIRIHKRGPMELEEMKEKVEQLINLN